VTTDFDFDFGTTSQPADDAGDSDFTGAASANNPFLFGVATDETGDDVAAVTQGDPWANTGRPT